MIPGKLGMSVRLKELVQHAGEFTLGRCPAKLPHVLSVGHRLVVMQDHFVIFGAVVAQPCGDGVGVIPVVATAGGIEIATRHLNADEIGQLLGVIQCVFASLLDDFPLLLGIRRRRRNVDRFGRRRGGGGETGGCIAELAQCRYSFGAGALALQILDGPIVQLIGELDVAQILGDFDVGLLELHRRPDEHYQLRNGHTHLACGGENGSGDEKKQTTHTILILSQVEADRRLSRAACNSGYWNRNPEDLATVGSTRWLASTISDISPRANFKAKAGTGKIAGRCSVAAIRSVNSRLVTGCGAVAFTAPWIEGKPRAKSARLTASSR